MEVFSCKTKIISGSGAIRELEKLGFQRILVVADPYFQNTDLPERLQTAAKAEKVDFFFEVTPDPEVALAARGAAMVKALQPDGVIALGGGSAMDCAKAAPGSIPLKHSI